MLGGDGARQHLGRPDVDGARNYLGRAGWAGKLPPTPAHQEKIRQYLWGAGWDGKPGGVKEHPLSVLRYEKYSWSLSEIES
jgi:hypothetical protein